MKTWLITGASSGLGHALAEYVLAQGGQAVITASSTKATTELARFGPRCRSGFVSQSSGARNWAYTLTWPALLHWATRLRLTLYAATEPSPISRARPGWRVSTSSGKPRPG
jgi:NAD(P)-dependent dehydrogenase (short-subunit alcohol dehydrogenase family)